MLTFVPDTLIPRMITREERGIPELEQDNNNVFLLLPAGAEEQLASCHS
jgi:hypothetical protein